VLRSRIESGEWQADERIPPEVELVRHFRVSRSTIREALRPLERERLIVRTRGRGTFVCQREEARPATIKNTLFGYEAEVRVLGADTISAPAHVGSFLGVPRGHPIRRFLRAEVVDGTPLAVVVNYMTLGLGRRIRLQDLRRYTMRECLRIRLGIALGPTHQVIDARMPDEQVASLLEIDLTHPVLFIQLLLSDVSGKPLQIADAFYRAGRYQYELDILPSGQIMSPDGIGRERGRSGRDGSGVSQPPARNAGESGRPVKPPEGGEETHDGDGSVR
jgi:GntR family transcriptional regulator